MNPKNENEARAQRAKDRRMRATGQVATSWQSAEDWDLAFWMQQTPSMRIEALEEMRHQQEQVGHARNR